MYHAPSSVLVLAHFTAAVHTTAIERRKRNSTAKGTDPRGGSSERARARRHCMHYAPPVLNARTRQKR